MCKSQILYCAKWRWRYWFFVVLKPHRKVLSVRLMRENGRFRCNRVAIEAWECWNTEPFRSSSRMRLTARAEKRQGPSG